MFINVCGQFIRRRFRESASVKFVFRASSSGSLAWQIEKRVRNITTYFLHAKGIQSSVFDGVHRFGHRDSAERPTRAATLLVPNCSYNPLVSPVKLRGYARQSFYTISRARRVLMMIQCCRMLLPWLTKLPYLYREVNYNTTRLCSLRAQPNFLGKLLLIFK